MKPGVKPQTINLMNRNAQTLLRALDASNEASCLGGEFKTFGYPFHATITLQLDHFKKIN